MQILYKNVGNSKRVQIHCATLSATMILLFWTYLKSKNPNSQMLCKHKHKTNSMHSTVARTTVQIQKRFVKKKISEVEAIFWYFGIQNSVGTQKCIRSAIIHPNRGNTTYLVKENEH